ncbi:hypothetical protein [Xenorhabdus kozodoii]|uniref:Uncharacterized protein n=1 Tax=Xenorhabdus kozodoii TaxID=351676 RepID=A0A2D0LEJ6_9GAMM|nr:hypothetical protein [Xenorhabdus kozodoii]PHM73837.1 hypothetical protein Xkoz_01341 [Xenorhabdus kozodoii]
MRYQDERHKKIFELSKKLVELKALSNQMRAWKKADDSHIYELRFHPTEQHQYVLINMVTQEETIPIGSYVFVNRIDEPGIIRMAKSHIYGHSSLTYYRYQRQGKNFDGNIAVYYAGKAEFMNGRLKWWTNESGHYKPSSDLSRNFIPYVSRLLPMNLFRAI